MKLPSLKRATPKSLEEHGANFTLDGLRYHFSKLSQYTNPTGGAIEKIPLNNKKWTAAYYAQFEQHKAKHFSEPAPWETPHPGAKPIFLRKKALYHVADHLLGIGKKSYWTGSTGRLTLLGLDIDDHESSDPIEVQRNSEVALKLFSEMTALIPVPCCSPRGINAFLICHKGALTTDVTNKLWHSIVKAVNTEAEQRGLKAKLECKGQARVFNATIQYCGVQLKDPFSGFNPTDSMMYEFWDTLEGSAIEGHSLFGILSTLASDEVTHVQPAKGTELQWASNNQHPSLLQHYKGNWAKQCKHWAIKGLPCDDSISQVVSELAKWLYFVELAEINETDRMPEVVNTLIQYCLLKHNGYITRLNNGEIEEVKSHISRLCESAISRMSEEGKSLLTTIGTKEYVDKWKLVPLMLQQDKLDCSFSLSSSVKITQCCSVLWVSAPEYWRTKAINWEYVPDNTPISEALESRIRRFYARNGLKINNPSIVKITRFLNYLKVNTAEVHLGVESLKKMGFTSHSTRKHIKQLEKMGLIMIGGYCPVAGVSKSYRLLPLGKELMGMEVLDSPTV